MQFLYSRTLQPAIVSGTIVLSSLISVHRGIAKCDCSHIGLGLHHLPIMMACCESTPCVLIYPHSAQRHGTFSSATAGPNNPLLGFRVPKALHILMWWCSTHTVQDPICYPGPGYFAMAFNLWFFPMHWLTCQPFSPSLEITACHWQWCYDFHTVPVSLFEPFGPCSRRVIS